MQNVQQQAGAKKGFDSFTRQTAVLHKVELLLRKVDLHSGP